MKSESLLFVSAGRWAHRSQCAKFPLALAVVAAAVTLGCGREGAPAGGATTPPASPREGREAEAAEAIDRGAGQRGSPAPQVEAGSPDSAQRWRMMRWRSDDGAIDPVGRPAALAHRAANIRFHQSENAGSPESLTWRELGPDNVGGRTRALLIDAVDPSVIWAGAVSGGIWRSTDAGATWHPVDDRMGNLAVSCFAMDPSRPAVMYASTGEDYLPDTDLGIVHGAQMVTGEGIWRSSDRGVTWLQMPSTAGFGSVNRIAIQPGNADTLVAAVSGSGAAVPGLYWTGDGGSSWALARSVAAGSNQGPVCFQVLYDPNNPNHCVASCSSGSDPSHRVFYSRDGGRVWGDANSGLVRVGNRIELAYCRANPGWLYAAVGTDPIGSANDSPMQIWRSTNGGVDWVRRTAQGLPARQTWYNNAIWVDPLDSNVLLIGEVRVHRSVDGGATFTQVSGALPHADVHGFYAPPNYDGVNRAAVYVCTDGGVFSMESARRTTSGSGWRRHDRGFRTVQFYGAAGHGASGRVTGGTQDNGHLTIESNSGLRARFTSGGDGGFAAIDPADANYIYGEYISMQIWRSTDGGWSSAYICNPITDAGDPSMSNFISPFVLDVNDPNRMLAGGRNLWRSEDVKSTVPGWRRIWQNSSTNPDTNITAIAIGPGNPDVVWIGDSRGRLRRTGNGTARSPNWYIITNRPGVRYVARILVDARDPNWVLVALGGFGQPNLWRTRDGGQSWVDIGGAGAASLPRAPIYGVAQHPTLRDRFYVGTEVGIFTTEDDCGTWSATNEGPADVCVDEVNFMHGSTTLLVATYGRGLWATDVAPCSVSLAPRSWAPSVQAGGSPARQRVTVQSTGGVTGGSWGFVPDAGWAPGLTVSLGQPTSASVDASLAAAPDVATGTYTGSIRWTGACGGATNLTASCAVTAVVEQTVATVDLYRTACGGACGVPYVGGTAAVLGASWVLFATNLCPGAPGYFLLGHRDDFMSGVPLPLDMRPFGAPHCYLSVASSSSDGGVVIGSASHPDGYALWSAIVPNSPALLGATMYAQYLSLDRGSWRPLGLSMSNAARARFGVAGVSPIAGMVRLPAGKFLMGSATGLAVERPVHPVQISESFWMSAHEVTQADYTGVMGQNPSAFVGATLPVDSVTWDEATAYCRALTLRERSAGRLPADLEYRLPTEAEWEFACRAGTVTEWGLGNSVTCNDANIASASGAPCVGRTTAVGSYRANPWGLHDMHGNVMEWCADAWDGAERHLVSEVEDPMSASGNGRVLRGGSFSLVAYGCRSAIRNFAAATRRDANWGFRVVLGPPAVAGFGEVRPHMVEVPAGLFQMGSTQGSPEEQPVHTVHITRPFWIGKYEVTYTEWQALMGTNPPGFRGPNLPVVSVSWSDAMAYCAALTAQERAAGRLPFGYQYRLPTEAEWEYCCRAGTTTEWNVGSSLNCGQANFGGFGGCVGQTASVGGYAANTWGLHDTHGNVWEWCLDAWDGYPNYPSGAVSDPYISSGPDRVLRGGSWFGVALLCRSAQRGWSAPDSLSADFGFRVALAPVLVP